MDALPHEAGRAGQAPIASTTVDAAIARVLAAEHSARIAVGHCSRIAAALVQQASERARAIAERGAARGTRVHDWTNATIAARLAAIETHRQALAAIPELNAAERHVLHAAVEQLAEALTGARGPS